MNGLYLALITLFLLGCTANVQTAYALSETSIMNSLGITETVIVRGLSRQMVSKYQARPVVIKSCKRRSFCPYLP